MCGIAGYWKRPGAVKDRSLLRGLCDRLVHRGPDAEGYFSDTHVGLGHRRLSIIDLSGGSQPLGNEDGSIQVVFNGEIYNYLELRERLLKTGHRFATRSDTEVLVHLYEDEGERMPELLNGMFALAIWDARRRRLFLARDRLGKKPLYYTWSAPGLRLCFASELKALLAVPGYQPEVNERSVADFLSLSYVPDPETIYRGIHKLAPAHSLTVTESNGHLRRYWEPLPAPAGPTDADRAVEEIRSLAIDAVERRLIADVPLGVFLSGGVDSSAVAGIMAADAGRQVRTFSIGFTDKSFDELRYARLTVDRHYTEHREEVVSPSILGVLEKLSEHYDEPFGDSSAIPMLCLARMTRQYVTVALCGDGADELFGGYRRYYYGVLEERLRDKFPGWFRRSAIRWGARCYPKLDFLPQVFRAKTLLTNLAQEIGDAYFTSMSAFRDEGLEAVLSPDVRRALGGYSPREAFRQRFHAVKDLPPLEQMQRIDLDTYLPGDILVKADRATMAYSLESRSPWLDYRLAELALRLPPAIKLNGRMGKLAFKRAVSPYVPAEVLTRRKKGFSVPLASWFRSSLKPVFQTLVLSSEMERLCEPAAVRRLWREHQSGKWNHEQKLWNLLMLALWDRRYVRRSRGQELSEMAART